MISMIHSREIKQYQMMSPINYDSYISWLDEESIDSSYRIISTSNVEIRKREEWNSLGREIHDANRTASHVQAVETILSRIGAKDFFAQHEYSPSIWFPKRLKRFEAIHNKVLAVQRIVPDIEVNSFDGGFLIKDQVIDFLECFIDYPFLMRYKNIDMISINVGLVVKITHHLTVDFVTLKNELVDQIGNLCIQSGLNYMSV